LRAPTLRTIRDGDEKGEQLDITQDLAGVNGDQTSRIFCQALDAELLSIAGIFMTKRQISSEYLGKQCRASLENGKIIIQLIQKESV
jgi:hypothetical protein